LRIATLLLLLFSLGCQRSMQEAEEALPAVGTPLPNFSLDLLDGGRISAADLHGQASVVALWSSTCSSSRAALDGIAALHRDLESRGLRVLVLADDTSASAVRAVLDSARISVPVAIAAGQIDPLFAAEQRFPWQQGVALPSFLVMDHAGTVRRRVVGIEQDPALRLQRVRRAVSELLP
jgi:peroxiredoxin